MADGARVQVPALKTEAHTGRGWGYVSTQVFWQKMSEPAVAQKPLRRLTPEEHKTSGLCARKGSPL